MYYFSFLGRLPDPLTATANPPEHGGVHEQPSLSSAAFCAEQVPHLPDPFEVPGL